MRRKTRKFNIFKTLSIVLILVFIFFIPFVIQKLIKIKKIECVSQFGQCPEELVNGMSYTVNRDYKTAKKQIKQQLESNIQINSYLIQYKIPSTLKVELNIKKPKYAIYNSQKFYLIEKNGLILSEAFETNLPTLLISDFQGNVGSKILDTEIFSLQIIEKIAWLYSIKTGVLEDNELKLTLKEGILVHFPIEGDVDVLVGSLRLIFSRLNDEYQGIKISNGETVGSVREIDLRYKSAILR